MMWLSEHGNLRVDIIEKGKLFRLSRWNDSLGDWEPMGESRSETKTSDYILHMRMTEYPDVPDYIGE